MSGYRNEGGDWVDPFGNVYPSARPGFSQEISTGSVAGPGTGGKMNGLNDAFRALFANTEGPRSSFRSSWDYSPPVFGGTDHEAQAGVRRQYAGALMDRENDERGFRDRAFNEDRRRYDARMSLLRDLFGRSQQTAGWGEGGENPFMPRAVGAAYQPFGQQPERQGTMNYLSKLMGQDLSMRNKFGGGRG